MNKPIYEIKEMPNGLKMLSVLPISETGIATAYCTVKNNPVGNSQGCCSANIYKKIGLENGIKDFKLCCEALGISDRTVVTNRLTAFTDKVRVIDEASLIGYDIYDEPTAPRADGLITSSNKVTLFNYAADCIITLVVDPVKKAVGSFHASWKGLLLGIAQNEINAFRNNYNSNPKDLIAVIMPSISVENYAIDSDRERMYIDAGYENHIKKINGTPHVDLSHINEQILLEQGLKKENVYNMDWLCTYKNDDLFYSFRRGPVDDDGVHHNGINGYFIKLN